MSQPFDRTEVVAFLRFLNHTEYLITLDVAGDTDSKTHMSFVGPFSTPEDAADCLANYKGTYRRAWVGINEPQQGSMHNHGKYKAAQYNHRKFIVIDVDPDVGPQLPLEKVAGILGVWAVSMGVRPARVCLSGRGLYLFFPCDLPSSPTVNDDIARLISSANVSLAGSGWKADTSLVDISKIIGLMGTRNYKSSSASQLRQTAKIIPAPTLITESLLSSVAAKCPALPSKPKPPKSVSAPRPVNLSSSQLLAKAYASKNGDKIRDLLEGDIDNHKDRSISLMSLCAHLMYWLGNDEDAVEAEVMASPWAGYDKIANRPDYLRRHVLPRARADNPYTPHTYSSKPQVISIGAAQPQPQPQPQALSLIPLQDDWFPPQIIELRNRFFEEYQANHKALTPKDMLLGIANYTYIASLRAALGKRVQRVTGSANERLYIGSGSIFVAAMSGKGKSPISTDALGYCCRLTERYAKPNKIALNATFNANLSLAIDYYSPMVQKGQQKKHRKDDADVKADCFANPNGVLMEGSESAGKLGQLMGAWMKGSDHKHLFIESLDNANDYSAISIASKMHGSESLYDHCIFYLGASPVSDWSKHIDPMSQENRRSGLLARMSFVCYKEGAYDLSSLNLSTNTSVDPLANVDVVMRSGARYNVVFKAVDRVAIESLDFGQHQSAFQYFLTEYAELIQSARDKIEKQAIGDAMLWAVLAGDIDHANKTVNIRPYYERCLKARMATVITSYYIFATTVDDTFDSRILEILAGQTKPMRKSELLNGVSKKEYHRALETLQSLIDSGRVKSDKVGATTWVWVGERTI